jgi:glucosylceramidase
MDRKIRNKPLRSAVALALTLALTACGDEAATDSTNQAPVITSSAMLAARADANYSYTVTASDADGDTVTYSSVNLPVWLTINTNSGLLTGTPSADDVGQHTITIIANDGTDTISHSFTITVVAEDVAIIKPESIVENGDFETALGNEWFFELAGGTPTIIDGQMVVVDLEPGSNPWEGRLVQNTDTVLTHGTTYKINFDAKAGEARNINIQLGHLFDVDPWFAPFMEDSAVALTTSMESYEVTFTADNLDGLTADLIFALGAGAATPITLDNVVITETQVITIIENGDFETALDSEWQLDQDLSDGTASVSIVNSQLVVDAYAASDNAWEPRLLQSGLDIVDDVTYKISFDAKAGVARNVQLQLGKLLDASPWFTAFIDAEAIELTTSMETYEIVVTANNPDGLAAEILFELGAGEVTPITLDNISITEFEYVQTFAPTLTRSTSDLTSVQTLELSSETEGAQIYYTTDGTTPTADSLLYTQPMLITDTVTIKSIAIKDNLESSDVVSQDYTVSGMFAGSYELSQGEIFQTSEAGDSQTTIATPITFAENTTLPSGNVIVIQPDVIKQTIDGFGGSLTESSAYILSYLTPENRATVMNAYFSEEGAGYTMSRTHIASTDFAVDGNYSYAPAGDATLADFSIIEDTKGFADTPVPDETGYYGLYDGLSPTDPTYDLLPLIKEAIAIAPDLRIIASPWTAPDWMKTNNDWYGGWLKDEHYSTFANYFSKYLAAYKAEGVNIWAVTPENEPHGNGGQWESMVFSPDAEANFIRENLGPTLAADGFADVKIIGYDQNRDGAKEFADALLADPDTAEYVYGTAIHWYGSSYLTFDAELDALHNAYPDKVILNSEATIDSLGDDEALYSWWKDDAWWWNENATEWGFFWAENKDDHPIYTPVHRYARNIIEGMNHWLTAWVDWNIVLDKRGGPNHVSNFCGAPVMIDPATGEVYYTPLYDVMSHFSKHIKPGDKVLNTATLTPELDSDVLHASAVQNANGDITMVVLNTSKLPVSFDVLIGNQKTAITIAANALQTIVLN